MYLKKSAERKTSMAQKEEVFRHIDNGNQLFSLLSKVVFTRLLLAELIRKLSRCKNGQRDVITNKGIKEELEAGI